MSVIIFKRMKTFFFTAKNENFKDLSLVIFWRKMSIIALVPEMGNLRSNLVKHVLEANISKTGKKTIASKNRFHILNKTSIKII